MINVPIHNIINGISYIKQINLFIYLTICHGPLCKQNRRKADGVGGRSVIHWLTLCTISTRVGYTTFSFADCFPTFASLTTCWHLNYPNAIRPGSPSLLLFTSHSFPKHDNNTPLPMAWAKQYYFRYLKLSIR